MTLLLRLRGGLFLTGLAVASAIACAEPSLVFTGDVMLSRVVARKLLQFDGSPWATTQWPFEPRSALVGNLEGALGVPADCLDSRHSANCFATNSDFLKYLKSAGFTAMGIENNHVADLGPVGRTATEQGLQAQELVPLTMERSPVFQAVGTHTVGIVPFTRIAGQDGKTQPLDLELEQRLDLARQLSDASIAFVHWGLEYTTWPSERQYVEAQTLASFGADVIVGSHPHVVQTPACVAGIPVFFSLGNHVFDQKYPVSKLGMLAKCDWSQGLLHCAGVRTSTGPDDISPVVTSEVVDVPCDASARDSLEFEGTQVRAQVPCAVSGPVREITLELKRAGEVVAVLPPKVIHRVLSMHLKEGVPASLVVLEDHFSKFDNKVAPRPYVYAVKERGLVAQWRGTTLAYPTVDLSVVHSQEGDVLCALHKRESPLLGALDGPALTTVAYVWDSFGFRGSKDDRSQQLCKARYAKNVNAS